MTVYIVCLCILVKKEQLVFFRRLLMPPGCRRRPLDSVTLSLPPALARLQSVKKLFTDVARSRKAVTPRVAERQHRCAVAAAHRAGRRRSRRHAPDRPEAGEQANHA